MKIYHAYYYSEGEECSMGYFIKEEDAITKKNSWPGLHIYIDTIEVEE